ncbi:MAG: DUF2182 domain-containing protein, partial [Gemmatimonadales bacterium]
VAMMLPSASPMILLFASVNRRRRERAVPSVRTAIFAAGYLGLWILFSALAALVQWSLHRVALLSPDMASASPVFGGILLLSAGIYQWLPVKNVCLTRCRSPLSFIQTEWREGPAGAVVMGLRHGLFCLGCCWVLMSLLFVAGVMNLIWVAAIAGFILLEKLAPGGQWVGKATGMLLAAWGAWLLLGAA